ncbi:MAG: hypothetical protein EA385_11520 [Salinarimonadaceae bacterium]|nr:MAG: hypothetical protein EA385_11520 [Salinarimonadaceae bacterium]
MTKRASLFGGKNPPAAEPTATPADSSVVQMPSTTPVAQPETAPQPPARKYPVAKTREGKRVATVYLEPEALRQLKHVSFDEETTVQELLVEGVNAVFEKRGLSRIA